MKQKQASNWRFILKTIAILFVVSWLFSGFLSAFFGTSLSIGNVALIPIKGTIVSEQTGGFIGQKETISSEIIKFLYPIIFLINCIVFLE